MATESAGAPVSANNPVLGAEDPTELACFGWRYTVGVMEGDEFSPKEHCCTMDGVMASLSYYLYEEETAVARLKVRDNRTGNFIPCPRYGVTA